LRRKEGATRFIHRSVPELRLIERRVYCKEVSKKSKARKRKRRNSDMRIIALSSVMLICFKS